MTGSPATARSVAVRREGPLTIVTIDRPAARNALHAAAHEELAAAFDAFADDDAQWVAIITGAGDEAFCAGHDLKQQASGGGLRAPPSGFGGLCARFDLAKPVIAAVNGVALGGGFEIALACDLIVAARHAEFALPEARVGLAAIGGGLQRLPGQIGLKRAMGLMLTGRRVSAEEGQALGFVNEVATDVMASARRWAAEIVACGPLSIRATKEVATAAAGQTIEEAYRRQRESPALRRMLASEDAIEGARAFVEKRRPVWTGR